MHTCSACTHVQTEVKLTDGHIVWIAGYLTDKVLTFEAILAHFQLLWEPMHTPHLHLHLHTHLHTHTYTQLDDKPIQHREVQDHESEMFKTYFNTVTILNGG